MQQLSDYDYTLPQHLIAQELAEPADSCKLLLYTAIDQSIIDSSFYAIDKELDHNSLLVFNNSKVIKARLPINTGEIFFLKEENDTTFNALVRPGKKFKVGSSISLPGTNIYFTVLKVSHEGRILECSESILPVLEEYGQMPLPPYISYDKEKSGVYQPVTAKKLGSVAAPTATLHFTPQLLSQLAKQGVQQTTCTLHVGLGTFKQVDTQNIEEYSIHSETVEINYALFDTIATQKTGGKSITGVGTTVTRSLETMPYIRTLLSDQQKATFSIETKKRRDSIASDIEISTAKKYVSEIIEHPTAVHIDCTLYIFPGFKFRIIDQLLTNFHLPKSSLLMLVAAFIGYDQMRLIYDHAITNEYMFYSFGDAMLLKRT